MARFGEFDKRKETFECYCERLESYFAANDIATGKQASCFISEVGSETYTLLKSLIPPPEKPKDKSYEDLKGVLTAHLSPKPLVIAERYKFYGRCQQPRESVATYAAELQRLASTCDFNNFLDEALHDKFVCGLSHIPTQKTLLAKDNLTFAKAKETAIAIELADKDSQELSNQSSGGGNQGGSNMIAAIASNQRRSGHKSNRNHRQGTASHKPGNAKTQQTRQVCYRCGKGAHNPDTCKYKEYSCRTCGVKGHLAAVCRKAGNVRGHTHFVNSDNSQASTGLDTVAHSSTDADSSNTGYSDDYETHTMGMFAVNNGYVKPIKVRVGINDIPTCMELDTGASKTMIPEDMYQNQFSHIPLNDCTDSFKTYSGDMLPTVGQLEVEVTYNGQSELLPLVVAKVQNQPPILGRNWLTAIKLDWQSIFSVHYSSAAQPDVETVCKKHAAVFQPGLGTMTTHVAKIHVKDNVTPKFHKARPVPYALKPAVDAKLDELISQGILVSVNHSEWAAPCVVVPKTDNSVRICGDYKVTINQFLDVDKYPLPTQQDLFATLAGGKYFTKLDLSQAYQQMLLEPDSQQYLTINTHRGLFKYTRLPYGVASAPSLFQKAMEQILQGLEGVIVFIDDILISAKDKAQHLERLDEVLSRLEQHGLRLKQQKCKFMLNEVTYLGHVISEKGIAATSEKVSAIAEATPPRNVQELRSFLGMLQYYAKFIPNLSDMIHPLNALLSAHTPFKWTVECDIAFESAKKALLSDTVLTHYDVTRPLVLACDASQYGVGAVLSHIMPDGHERPIAYASRTLTPSEKNYGQIQKEALSLVFGVKKYHQYLYGRQFTLVTDHKPLLTILGPKSGVPTLAAARLQRWAIVLSAYRYNIQFKNTGEHLNADALSRLPTMQATAADEEPSVFNFNLIDEQPVTAKDIESATRKDPILSRVFEYTMSGWPSDFDQDQLKPYYNRRHELSVECGVVLWGLRVCVPTVLRSNVLQELHNQHLGICRMKSLARGYFWWPGLDADIEKCAKDCEICISVKNAPPSAPLQPWKWATRRFERIHLDFAEKDSKNFLVLIDAYSKWLEVLIMPNITSSHLIEVLRPIFAAHGLPEVIVTDNGPSFTSSEFQQFCKLNGMVHKLTPPYHPASNGAAERSVQLVKRALNTSKDSGLSLQHRIANFLLMYRNTPQTTTGCTPAELFLKCKPRIHLSLLKPSLTKKVEVKQDQMKMQHDGKRTLRSFLPGDKVMVQNFRGKEKWMPGVILQRLGTLTYAVQCGNNNRYVHIDHLIAGCDRQVIKDNLNSDQSQLLESDFETAPNAAVQPVLAPQEPPQAPVANPERRYPARNRKPPTRLDL